jgi:hypothetical protein
LLYAQTSFLIGDESSDEESIYDVSMSKWSFLLAFVRILVNLFREQNRYFFDSDQRKAKHQNG